MAAKRIIVLGAGGFIGGHLCNKLKNEGHWVRGCDIKRHEYFEKVGDEFTLGDLRDPKAVELVIEENIDEVYQLAADMGGAGYLFSGENDANVMHNSALINLNVAQECLKKGVGKIFYSSSACIYPEHNQLDPDNPDCKEDTAYPAAPDSEYGWEKLFSERLYLAFFRNYGLNIRIARFHNIFGPMGVWNNGKEKVPAAICRKVAEAEEGGSIEVWGDGKQTRSFLYIDECLEAIDRLMKSSFIGPVNIGSEEMISINDLAKLAMDIGGKNLSIDNIDGQRFQVKYGFKCPQGVRGRNSDNSLFFERIGWKVNKPLREGVERTYKWIHAKVKES